MMEIEYSSSETVTVTAETEKEAMEKAIKQEINKEKSISGVRVESSETRNEQNVHTVKIIIE